MIVSPELRDAVVAFATAAGGAGLALKYSRRAGLYDLPNPRSSHTVPTPRGGGVGVVFSIALVLAYSFVALVRVELLFPVLFALVGLGLVGWLDDHNSMAVSVRLVIHFACGVAVAALVNAVAPVPGPANLLWLGWWLIWTIGSINVVNFMDGIDGLVGSQALLYGLYLYALLPHELPGARFGLVLAAASFGFLVWNWPPARIFLGDVGSGPLGFLFVVGGALALERASAALVFLPLYPLFFDALATLVRRHRRGEKLYVAHRSHLYQRLANGPYGHARVTLMYAVAAMAGAAIALVLRGATAVTAALAIFFYLTLVTLCWWRLDRQVPLPDRPG